MKAPEYYLPIMPYLIVNKAEAFIAFIKTVFKAEEQMLVPRADGTVMHAEFTIGKAAIMFAEATEDFKPLPAGMFIFVSDINKTYDTALNTGAHSLQEIADRDYGKSGGFQDPFGNQWWIVAAEE